MEPTAPGVQDVAQTCQLIELPIVHDQRGNLTFVEGNRHIPFDIKRVYYLYDVPGGTDRGGHAHKELDQFLVAMSGSFDVHVDNGIVRETYHMNRSYYGLYMPKMTWRYLDNFSSGSICMVMASEYFQESDYYRKYENFIKAVRERYGLTAY